MPRPLFNAESPTSAYIFKNLSLCKNYVLTSSIKHLLNQSSTIFWYPKLVNYCISAYNFDFAFHSIENFECKFLLPSEKQWKEGHDFLKQGSSWKTFQKSSGSSEKFSL